MTSAARATERLPRRVPELPEVETVRAGLAAHVVGRRVAAVSVLHERAVRRHRGGADDLAARLVDQVVTAAVRRGKYLWLLLDGGTSAAGADALVLHLGMSGQLLVRETDQTAGTVVGSGPVPGHLRAWLTFDGGGGLWFVDQRTFGHLLVAPLVPTPDGGPGGTGSPAAVLPVPVQHIARDLLDPVLAPGTTSRAALVDRIRARRTGIKRALLDQGLLSGIGNIYADEGLWRAREHYEHPTTTLTRARVAHVLDAVAEVMQEALVAGGTSFDSLYVDVNGASGYFDRSLAVYGRAALPCRRCGTPVVRESFMNRSSFRCPRCQRASRSVTGGSAARGRTNG